MKESKVWVLTKKTKLLYEAILKACDESSYCSWGDRQLQQLLYTYQPLSKSLQTLVKKNLIYRLKWGRLRHIIPKIYNERYLNEFLIPSFGERAAKKMLYFKNFCMRSIPDWPEKKSSPRKE